MTSLHESPTWHASLRLVTFEVIGEPKPQGSMKAFNAGGFARVKPSGGEAFASWRNAVPPALAHAVAAINRPTGATA